jgi:hypothetical protein
MRKTIKYQRIIRQQTRAIETVKHYDPAYDMLIRRDLDRMHKKLNGISRSYRDYQITGIGNAALVRVRVTA